MCSSLGEAEASDLSAVDVAAPPSEGTQRAPLVASRPRLVRVGLLGLGNVGQAVARLASRLDAEQTRGLDLRIEGALVRDVARPRRCQPPARLTTNPFAFLRGQYDVVIEALGGLEPARTIVARLLGRGTPVVTANKTLVAAAGQELLALAAARGTSLRYEASALAGVPFLGTLAARPLVSAIDRFAAVLNGTSNFILSTLETGGTFADALELAARRGLTEPDPSRDLDGDDAVDKLALLCGLCGWGHIPPAAIETTSIRHVMGTDIRAARSLGGALKPLAVAARTAEGIEAFVGPAFVPARSPLGTLHGTLNGIELHGRYVRDLFFSGPGAGPDVTAATLLDDCIETMQAAPEVAVNVRLFDADASEAGAPNRRAAACGLDSTSETARQRSFEASETRAAVSERREGPFLRPLGACVPDHGPLSATPRSKARRSRPVSAPTTPWLLRVGFPGIVPTPTLLTEICSRHGLSVDHVTDPVDNARYVLVTTTDTRAVDAALETLQRRHRIACAAFRRLVE